MNNPENAFIGTDEEVSSDREFVSQMGFESKEKKLYLSSNIITKACFSFLVKKSMERMTYQFISNSLAGVCGLMSSPYGKNMAETLFFSFKYLFIWLCWILVVAHKIFVVSCRLLSCNTRYME